MEHNEAIQLRDPTQGERFKWFAICHFSISILGVVGAFLSTALDGAMVAVLFLWEAVLLALYAVAGVWIARKRNWCKPQGVRGGVRAFLSPALVAWVWGGLFLMFLCVPGLMSSMGDAGDLIGIGLMYSLLFLAFPSSGAFIILVLLVGGLEADFSGEWLLFFVYMLIVGAVPPGLFLLGSTLGTRKEQSMTPQE